MLSRVLLSVNETANENKRFQAKVLEFSIHVKRDDD
jgi:hypothetical protein